MNVSKLYSLLIALNINVYQASIIYALSLNALLIHDFMYIYFKINKIYKHRKYLLQVDILEPR